MTAIGFVLIVIALVLGVAIRDGLHTPDLAWIVTALIGLAGVIHLTAGIATWLWRVMP